MIIDPNARVNHLFEKVGVFSNVTAQRITEVALPFLMLYRPVGLAVNTVLGTTKACQVVTLLPGHVRRQEWLLLTKQVSQLALTVSTVALAFLMPQMGIILSQGYQLIVDIDKLRASIALGNWKEASAATLSITTTLVFSASILYATPEVIVISILAQAFFELYQSMDEIRAGRYLEAAGKAAMAAIRVNQAIPVAQTLHRNYYGTKVNKFHFRKAVNEAAKTGKTVEEVLKRRYMSSHIEGLDLREREFDGLTFDNLTFENCLWNESKIRGCKFFNVTFNHCSLVNVTAISTIFSRCVFQNSNLHNMAFFNGLVYGSFFNASDLTRTCFNHSGILHIQYKACKLLETSFLGAQVAHSQLTHCDLTDTLLCENKDRFTIEGGTPHRFTRPVVALGWNFAKNQTMALVIQKALHDAKTIPLRYEYSPPQINPEALDEEVQRTLLGINKEASNFLSIADELLKKASPYSEIAHTQRIADTIVRYSNGVLLPGGLDIQPAFYGESASSATLTDKDFRRSILEFALIDAAEKQKTPLMGICRGSQVINVYYGGSLKQDIAGHKSTWHAMEVNKNAPLPVQKIVQDIIGEKIIGRHLHHQASDKIGKGLHVAIEVEGTPETLVSDDGRILATQFHPEIYIDDTLFEVSNTPEYRVNANFFTRFQLLAAQTRFAA